MWYPIPQLGKNWATSKKFFFFLRFDFLAVAEAVSAEGGEGGEGVEDDRVLMKLRGNLSNEELRRAWTLLHNALAIASELLPFSGGYSPRSVNNHNDEYCDEGKKNLFFVGK